MRTWAICGSRCAGGCAFGRKPYAADPLIKANRAVWGDRDKARSLTVDGEGLGEGDGEGEGVVVGEGEGVGLGVGPGTGLLAAFCGSLGVIG